jgi:hypothetical protein
MRFAFFPLTGLLLAFFVISMVILLAKSPKARGAVLGAVVALLIFFVLAKHSVPMRPIAAIPQAVHKAIAHVEEPIVSKVTKVRSDDSQVAIKIPSEAALAPVWSDAMEDQFEADLYPSQSQAVGALGLRIARYVRESSDDGNTPKTIHLFATASDAPLGVLLKKALEARMPDTAFSVITGGTSNSDSGAAVTIQSDTAWQNGNVTSGRVQATLSEAGSEVARWDVPYTVKPWVENFSWFASSKPNEHFIVARSNEACTSESQARQQAMLDAVARVQQQGVWSPGSGARPITVSREDLEQGGFIADQFVQSFHGSAGKIWRQALLIDVSAPKLAWLNNRLHQTAVVAQRTWINTVLSAFGVLAVILVTYLFLNMATRGYYEWSLRIAGVVLAVVAIVVFLIGT